MGALRLLDWDLVRRCRDGKEAVLLCIEARAVRMPLHDLALQLGMDKGHFSRVMCRQAHFPDHKRTQLMALCGNLAPLQYEAWATGFDLIPRRTALEEKIQGLQRQIQDLQAAMGAA